MIQVYRSGNEDFSRNGDAVLHCFSCEVLAQLSGSWHLEMEVPIDDEGRWKLVTEEAVLKVPTWQDDEQLYRISRVTKTEDGVSVVAYPIFYDSADDCFLMDVRPTGKNGQEALDLMMVGSQYGGRSDIAKRETAYFIRRNLMDAINGQGSPTFIERWGGEIIYDNYDIVINERVGRDYGVEARYGRNINGVTYIVDTSEVITRIVPIAYNGHMMSGSQPWVDSSNIESFAKVYTREVRYDDIRMAEDARDADDSCIICNTQAELDNALREAAEADFANGVDAPKVTLDIDMAIIRSMRSAYQDNLLDENGEKIIDTNNEEIYSVWYRDYSTFEDVRLGDTIRCRHYKLDITSVARVIALTWDCVRKCVSHVTLGDYQYDYVKAVSGAINRVARTIRDDGSVVAERVRGFLDGAQTQLRTQYNLAQKQDVLAILFENLDTESPMYGALGIGTQGICISKTRTEDGRDWDWTTGITANGINASVGVFGLLADKMGRNYINLDTGDISISSETLIGGKTIDEYMSEGDAALAEYARTTNLAIQHLQDQIDGQYDTYFEQYDPTLNNYPANEWTTDALKYEHQGDLFYNKDTGASYRFFRNDDTGQYEWVLITDTVAASAMQVASRALDTADGKRRVFTAVPVPPYDGGDLYFTGEEILVCVNPKASGASYAASDFARRDAYNSASSFNSFLTEYNSTLEGIRSDIDDRIETWSQSDDPSGSWSTAAKAEHVGDIWYDTSTGVMKWWDGTAWSDMTTTPPPGVISSIDAKATVFTAQPRPPYRVGDLWFDSESADIMTCIMARPSGNYNAADWQKRNKYTDDSALDNYRAEMAGLTDDLQEQLDGKVETWYQPTDPSLTWTGMREDPLQDSNGADILDEDSEQIGTPYEHGKSIHIGDLWHNTADNTQWRWNGGAWEAVDIPDVVKDTIDGKKAIFSSQPVPPYEQCDLWVQGETGDILVCTMGRKVGEAFSASDWTLASKYTDDSALQAWISGEYSQTIQELQEQADGKAETWYQPTDPSEAWETPEERSLHRGDLWYDTTGQTTWFWSGSAWEQQNVPIDVFDKIDTKAQIFASQPTIPYYENDLWYTGTVVKVCTMTRTSGAFNQSDWMKKDYYTDDSALQEFIDNEFSSMADSVLEQLDRKIETWYQPTDPSINWTGKALDSPLEDSSGAKVLDSDGLEILTDWESEKAAHMGDLWTNTATSEQWRYGGGIWEAITIPNELMDTIDGKASVYVGSATPADPQERDLWFKGPDEGIYTFVGGEWRIYNKYTDDSALSAWLAGDYADTIRELREQDDRKAETWYQDTDPALLWTDSTVHEGDLWYNTTDQTTWRWSGNMWRPQSVPVAVFDTIDSKAQIFADQPTVPYYVNDLWYTGTVVKVCIRTKESGSFSAGDWEKKDYYTDDESLETFVQTVYTPKIEDMQGQLDGKVETWFYAYAPVASKAPESSWTTADEKGTHVGDLFYDITSGSECAYRYEKSGSTFKWTKISDASVTKALADASKAQSTADGKRTIFTAQPAPPYQAGDMWITGSGESGEVRYCIRARATGSYAASDWALTPTEAKAQATIESLNGEIIAKVVAGDIINAINISSEGISIDASKININGATSINNYFKVNTDGTFSANKGTIGNITVASNAIYSGTHTTYNSSNKGFYLGADGKLGIGNGTSYLRYNGDGALDIKATTVTVGGKTAATTDITDAIRGIAEQGVSDAGDAAKVATNFLYYDETNGLIVSEVGQSSGASNHPYNAQIKGDGIYFRTGTKNLSKISGTAFTIYLPGSSKANVKMMELTSSGLFFYKSTTATEAGSEVVAAKYTSNGLEVLSGKIAGFTIASQTISVGTLGDGENKSVFVSSGTTGKAIIGGSAEIGGWVFTSRNTFGVNATGAMYASSGLIGGVQIASGSLHTAGRTAYNGTQSGFFLGSDGSFGVGGESTYLRYGTNGSLDIKATSISIAGESVATQDITRGIRQIAEGAASAASTAQSTAEDAAKTATNFLFFDETNGLIVSEVGNVSGSTTRPYNVQILGSGINFRTGTRNMGRIDGDAFTLYVPKSTRQNVKMMELTSSGLFFYKSTTATEAGSEVVAAKYTSNGLEVLSGKIAGFTIASQTISVGTLGDGENKSVFVSSGTTGKAIIGGSAEIGGWVFTSRNTFGVNSDGKMYASSGLIGGLTISGGGIYSGSHSSASSTNAGFYLGSGGTFGVGDGNNYLRWTGSALNIKASSITLGSSDIGTAISNAQTTATSYLHVTTDGLVVNNNESNTNTGCSVRIGTSAVEFRSGSTVKSRISSSSYQIYRTVGSQERTAVSIDNSGITLYKPDGTVGASVTSAGLSFVGTLANMTINTNDLRFYDSSNMTTVSIGHSNGYAFRVYNNSGTTISGIELNGKLYSQNADISGKISASKGCIGNWTINASGLTYSSSSLGTVTIYPGSITWGNKASIAADTGRAIFKRTDSGDTYPTSLSVSGKSSFTGMATFVTAPKLTPSNLVTYEYLQVPYLLGIDAYGNVVKVDV